MRMKKINMHKFMGVFNMKKGIIKNVIVTGLISIMAVGLAGCGNSATKKEDTGVLDSIKESGKLVVGLSADYAPYEFHIIENGQDKIVGFDVSLAKEIADELDVELEIKGRHDPCIVQRAVVVVEAMMALGILDMMGE